MLHNEQMLHNVVPDRKGKWPLHCRNVTHPRNERDHSVITLKQWLQLLEDHSVPPKSRAKFLRPKLRHESHTKLIGHSGGILRHSHCREFIWNSSYIRNELFLKLVWTPLAGQQNGISLNFPKRKSPKCHRTGLKTLNQTRLHKNATNGTIIVQRSIIFRLNFIGGEKRKKSIHCAKKPGEGPLKYRTYNTKAT